MGKQACWQKHATVQCGLHIAFYGAWACHPNSNFWDVLVEFHWFWWLKGMIDRIVSIIICHHVKNDEASPTRTLYPQVRHIDEQLTDHQTVDGEMKTYTKRSKKYVYTHAPWLWYVTLGSFHIDISRHRRAQTERFQEEAGCARRNHTRPTCAGLTRAQTESGTCYHEYWCKPLHAWKSMKTVGLSSHLITKKPILLVKRESNQHRCGSERDLWAATAAKPTPQQKRPSGKRSGKDPT